MIKLIALDLDGTTLQNDHAAISPRTGRAIEAAVSRNILVVPVTGRIRSFLPPSVTGLGGIDYAITSYGSVICDLKGGTVLASKYIPQDRALWVLRQIPEQTYTELWSRGEIFIGSDQYRRLGDFPLLPLHRNVLRKVGRQTESLPAFICRSGQTIEKISLPCLSPELKQSLWRTLSACPGLFPIDVGAGIEIVSAGASKADGLEAFCAYLSRRGRPIGMEDVLAFGDSEGDTEMIRRAGIGIAMGNACEALKELADGVTLSNDRDGVAVAIEWYALSPSAESGRSALPPQAEKVRAQSEASG